VAEQIKLELEVFVSKEYNPFAVETYIIEPTAPAIAYTLSAAKLPDERLKLVIELPSNLAIPASNVPIQRLPFTVNVELRTFDGNAEFAVLKTSKAPSSVNLSKPDFEPMQYAFPNLVNRWLKY